ncbi:hypothetical protein QQS21_010089 [Conoideocrella luteorostrata]|uniref:Secreted protein n=1 Tax=Conoideocrella luteorostrata TaxID=1105319 RepID=A0AAJ0CFU5_9HYPO|nr:hypothetical protein QQS21_010089 [Conoideocrella luteorostrata]
MKFNVIIFASALSLTHGISQNASAPEKKLPWLEPGVFSHECGAMSSSERDCGTKTYCEMFYQPKFKTTKECFSAHNSPSAPSPLAAEKKLPWLEPGVFSHECGAMSSSERDCGTKTYCETFYQPKFGTKEDCFSAHDSPPAQ